MRVMLWVGSALAVVSVVFSAFMPVVRALDTTPPTIHDLMFDPPRSLAGGSVRIYAWVTDDTAVTDVAANVTRPDGNHENDTMYGPPAYIFYIGGTRNTSLVGTY